jgi:hypothetical protein
MAGRMGSETVTVRNLEVVEITADGILLVKGLIPGSVNTIVVINKKGVNKKFVPLYKEAVEGVQIEIESHPSVSTDAQQSGKVTSEPEAASLSDSSAPVSEEKPEVKVEPAVDSVEDVQVPLAQDGEVSEAPVEVKIEASEIPPMQDEAAAPVTVEEAQKEEKIGDENANS